jgi:hypothetical protein
MFLRNFSIHIRLHGFTFQKTVIFIVFFLFLYGAANYGAKRDEVIRGWRKLHNEELHKVYRSPGIIRSIKSRRMRWAGHAARIGRRAMHIGFWCESRKERDH